MNNIEIIELAQYEKPTIKESNREEWVEFGEDNNYFNWLIDRYRNSTTNNAVINNVSRLTYGGGLHVKNASKNPTQYARLKSLIKKNDLRNVIQEFVMLGNAAFQVVYNKKRDIVAVKHIPVHLLRAEKCDEDGNINNYYYSDNWEDLQKFPTQKIPAFGTSKSEIEIFYIKPYTVGLKYYASVNYEGGLPYTILEEEVSKYLINEVQNSFSGTKIINFNNGIPDEEAQKKAVRKVMAKLTGSTGDKVIIGFNDNETQKTTIDNVPLDNAPEHYAYLSKEAEGKILEAHNVTSPMLVGVVTDNQGFSSNADEIEIAGKYFYSTTIRPYQDVIIEALEEILDVAGLSLELYFKRLDLLSPEYKETNTNLSKVDLTDLVSSFASDLDENEFTLLDSIEVNEESDEKITDYLNSLSETYLSKVMNFVKTGTARTRSNVNERDLMFVSRYRYVGNPNPERDFCKAMMKAKKIYRLDDIQRMSGEIVNAGWGPKGADTYDIWKYKGGGNCHHKWQREIYLRKSDYRSPLAKKYSPTQVRKLSGQPIANEPDKKTAFTEPINLPYNGFLPPEK